MDLSNYIELLKNRGKPLMAIGVNSFALDKESALIAIGFLQEANIPILGGDVFKQLEEKLTLTYDNWSCQKEKYSSNEEYINASLEEAKEYIENYKANRNELVYFELVLPY